MPPLPMMLDVASADLRHALMPPSLFAMPAIDDAAADTLSMMLITLRCAAMLMLRATPMTIACRRRYFHAMMLIICCYAAAI